MTYSQTNYSQTYLVTPPSIACFHPLAITQDEVDDFNVILREALEIANFEEDGGMWSIGSGPINHIDFTLPWYEVVGHCPIEMASVLLELCYDSEVSRGRVKVPHRSLASKSLRVIKARKKKAAINPIGTPCFNIYNDSGCLGANEDCEYLVYADGSTLLHHGGDWTIG